VVLAEAIITHVAVRSQGLEALGTWGPEVLGAWGLDRFQGESTNSSCILRRVIPGISARTPRTGRLQTVVRCWWMSLVSNCC